MFVFNLRRPEPLILKLISGVKKSARVKQKPKEAQSVTTEKEHVNIVFIGHVGKDSVCSPHQQ